MASGKVSFGLMTRALSPPKKAKKPTNFAAFQDVATKVIRLDFDVDKNKTSRTSLDSYGLYAGSIERRHSAGSASSETTTKSTESASLNPYTNDGVLYYLATNGHTTRWANPHEAGKVEVVASSVGGEPVAAVVDNQRGFFHTGNAQGNWILVDLKGKRVVPTGYKLSHGGLYRFYPRNWRVEGSCDGSEWVILSEHKNDESICEGNLTARWAIEPSTKNEGYSLFRIVATDENAYGTYTMYCSGFEIFGTVLN
eukprot:comp18292_c0_seq1/m.19327 comp18292_c0_seq1/g.19327  ORF comp18292_c0_seq1/g.19327 comp18292_c0_seq1/m.19327 type:complete len:254 (-) comp18292_c0_seq1:462-1223(-)